MFGKMMNNYYYGKSGKGDYNKDDLPQNRWQLFWEMLRIRFSGLIRLNLLYMLVWIPSILVILFSFLNWYSLMGLFIEQTVTGAEFSLAQSSIISQCLLLLIPCIAITGPFTAGVSYVTRNWARDEHAFIWSDFKDAVKENWKQSLGISIITGFVPFIVFICWQFYGQMAGQYGMFFIVPQVLTLVIGIVWALGLVFFYPLIVSYKLKFTGIIRNGLLLAVGRLPQTIGVRLATLVPAIIGIVLLLFTSQVQWVVLGFLIYYILIGYSLKRFVDASFTNSVFDRFINVHIEGVEVDRGLNKEIDEDEDDDEEDEEE